MINPFFSILIASYNRPDYIGKCISSILENDFNDYEIIISDDNSPRREEIKAVVDKFIVGKNNITYYQQSINLKEPGNKSFLASVAKGQYTIQIGDDDTLLKHSLKSLSIYIRNNPDNDIYTFGYNIIDENDRIILSRKALKGMEINLDQGRIVKELITFDIFPFWLFHPSIFCAKNGLEQEFPYSLKAGIGEDFQFLIEVLNGDKKLYVIPDILFNWRKIQNINNAIQINQSHYGFRNIIARRMIYYNYLYYNSNIKPIISDYVSTYNYRKRFIYIPFHVDKTINQKFASELDLPVEHYNELIHFCQKNNKSFLRLSGRINRSINYSSYFGFKGILEIVKLISRRYNNR